MRRRHRDEKLIVQNKIRSLVTKLNSKSLAERIDAVKSLGSYGRDSAIIADKLIPFVEDEDETLRYCAMQALSEISRASPKVAKLIRSTLLQSKDHYVRGRGYWILERVEKENRSSNNG